METEIKEAFEYLKANPAGLTPGELGLVESFRKYFKEHGELSERQAFTLLQIRKYRERRNSHLY